MSLLVRLLFSSLLVSRLLVCSLFLVVPMDVPAIFPATSADLAIFLLFYALAVHLALKPSALIVATVGPLVDAMAFALVAHHLPLVRDAVGLGQSAPPVHLVREILALVPLPVLPLVGALPLELVLEEVALVDGAILESQLAMAMLLPHVVAPLVVAAIGPPLLPLTMVLVIEPVAFIPLPILVRVNTVAVRNVIEKHTFVYVPIRLS